MHGSTIVDASIINAPSSIKNTEKARDPEMCQTKKGKEWRFGMKTHIGVDAGTGYVIIWMFCPWKNRLFSCLCSWLW